MGMSAILRYLFTGLTLLTLVVTFAHGDFCRPQVTSLINYTEPCHNNSQCVTRYCSENRCVCRSDRYFDKCTSMCLPKCNTTITSTGGNISGPGYPNNQSPFYCTWTITGGYNTYVVFSLTDLDLRFSPGCDDGYIEIVDSDGITLLNRLCNENDSSIRTVASWRNSLTVRVMQKLTGYRTFTSTFQIYSIVSTIISNPSGYIASPYFPVVNNRNIKLSWTIIGKFITLNIPYCQLGYSETLIVYNGTNDTSMELVRKRAGCLAGHLFAQNALHIVYTAESWRIASGFNASYTIEGEETSCDMEHPGVCNDPNLECRQDKKGKPRCLCVTGRFANKNKCINDVLISYITHSHSVQLTLVLLDHFVDYQITWWTRSSNNEYFVKNTTSNAVFITGLIPGQEYWFNVTLRLPSDDMHNERFFYSDWSLVTIPSPPGKLIEDLSNLELVPYVFVFQPSEGAAHHYKVNFETNVSRHTYNVTSPKVTTFDLISNTEYNYSIMAVNKLGNHSELTSGMFKTTPELIYGEHCNQIHRRCKNPDLMCRYDKNLTLRCLCPDDSYYNSRDCLQDLKIALDTKTKEINLIITSSVHFYKHKIAWSTAQDDDYRSTKQINSTENSISLLLSNLIPGQEYVLKVDSYLASDAFYRERIFRSKLTTVMLPAAPGHILENESELNIPPYVLKFKPADGIVRSYRVTLMSHNETYNDVVNVASVMTSKLTPNTVYNYTVTAYNKLGNSSEAVTGTFTVYNGTKPVYGVPCLQSSDICKYAEMVCKYDTSGQARCLCGDSHIYATGSCLLASSVWTAFGTTTSVRLTHKDGIPFIGHSLTWSDYNNYYPGGVLHNVTSRNITITELMDGLYYTFRIFSTLSADQYNPEKNLLTVISVSTSKINPGSIIESESNFQTPPYKLKFLPAGPSVKYYRITFQHNGGSYSVDTNTSEYITRDFQNNTEYSFGIYAVNYRYHETSTVTGKFTIGKVTVSVSKHGNTCNIAVLNECKSPDLICIKDKVGQLRCLCPDGTFHKDNKCVNDIKIEYDAGTSEISLTLTSSAQFHKHQVSWTTGLFDKYSSLELNDTSTNIIQIRGLLAGESYFLKIHSYLASDLYYNEKIFLTKLKIFTLPAIPGHLVENQSKLRIPPYIISFLPSAGVVQYYNITFKSSNVSFNHIVNIPSVKTSALTKDTVYNYTITAYDRFGNASNSVIGTFQTGKETNFYYGDVCVQYEDVCKHREMFCRRDKLGQHRCLSPHNFIVTSGSRSDFYWSTTANDSSIQFTTPFLTKTHTLWWSSRKGLRGVVQNKTGQNIVISGLAPSQYYTFFIATTFNGDDYDSEKVLIIKTYVWSDLPKGGKIYELGSNFQYPLYKMKLKPLDISVDFYTIRLMLLNKEFTFPLKANSSEYTTFDLLNNTLYFYEIRPSVNGYSTITERGSFKTGPDTRYGVPCKETEIMNCNSAELICRKDNNVVSRCLCPEGVTHRDGKCLGGIKVNFMTVTNGLKVTTSSDIPNLSHNVTWSALTDYFDHGLINTNRSNDVIIVSGLTPGQEYLFKVYSYLPADSFTQETIVQNSYSTVTAAAKPGAIIENESNLGIPPYTLKFTPSEGLVQYYKAVLQSSNSLFNYTVEAPEILTSDLTRGMEYNYSITAYNRLDIASQPIFGTFKIH